MLKINIKFIFWNEFWWPMNCEWNSWTSNYVDVRILIIADKITRLQGSIEPIWAPKGATEIYNHKKEDEPKVRTHVNKMMFTYKCVHI